MIEEDERDMIDRNIGRCWCCRATIDLDERKSDQCGCDDIGADTGDAWCFVHHRQHLRDGRVIEVASDDE